MGAWKYDTIRDKSLAECPPRTHLKPNLLAPGHDGSRQALQLETGSGG